MKSKQQSSHANSEYETTPYVNLPPIKDSDEVKKACESVENWLFIRFAYFRKMLLRSRIMLMFSADFYVILQGSADGD